MGQHGYNQGDFGWTQLNATDPQAALDFYTALTGWERKEAPMPDYYPVARGDEMLGAIAPAKEGESAPGWMPYITVDDIDATLAKAEELGATVVMPATPLPGDAGSLAVIKDPQGTVTGLAQYPPKK